MYGAQAFANDTPGIDITKFAGIPGVADTKSAAELSGNRYEEMANPFTDLRSILEEIAYDIKSVAINTLETVEILRSMLPSDAAIRNKAISGEDRDPVPGAGKDEDGRPNTFQGLADAANTDFGKLLIGAGLLLAITKFQDKLIPMLTKTLEGLRSTFKNTKE